MIGSVLNGRFRIEEALARSAQSEVYKASDLTNNSLVALKLLRPRLFVGDSFGARLRREFHVLKELDHPGAARAIDFGQTTDKMVYFAMEYVAGRTLNQVLAEEGPLDLLRVSLLLDQIAEVLDAAHGRQIVHRNLNPDNLLLFNADDGSEKCKILDFGLAKLLEEKSDIARTGNAIVYGKPAFMCPDQATGRGVNRLADIYSLGVLLAYVLTGKLPYSGSDYEIIIAHVQKPFPAFRELNPERTIPEAVEAVVRRAAAKKPGDRPQTAKALAGEFRKACGRQQNDEAVYRDTRPVGVEVRGEKKARTSVATIPLNAARPRTVVLEPQGERRAPSVGDVMIATRPTAAQSATRMLLLAAAAAAAILLLNHLFVTR